MSGGGALARLRTLAGQSLIYGIGPVVARFAGLLLLPVYTRHLGKSEVANVGQVVALVAVGATVAQLGLVNALFRFAAEREGEARFAVARTAVAMCAAAVSRSRWSRRSRRRLRLRSSSVRATRASGSWPAPAC